MEDQEEQYKVMLEQASMKLNAENVTLRTEVEQLTADLELARTYQGIEGPGCPLCSYQDGVFVAHCSLHRQINQARKTAEYWKAEHLAGNEEIKALYVRIDTMTKMLADAGIIKLREPEKGKCEVALHNAVIENCVHKCGHYLPCPFHQ